MTREDRCSYRVEAGSSERARGAGAAAPTDAKNRCDEQRDNGPRTKQQMWSPISSTLIYGRLDAVLVDAFITVEQADTLVDWVAASGKNLTTIYATHGHGDHFFGASTVLPRFPRARLVAAPDVVRIMRQQASPQALASLWDPFFPGQMSDHLVIAEELTENVMDIEGHDLVVVPLGHTDTDYTTCLHVPSIGLVVAGDAAYNGVHLYLAESNPQTRHEWIAALDRIEALKPCAVIAGHKKPENDDSPRIIEETRQYIHDFHRVAKTSTAARELYDKMLELIRIGSIRARSGFRRARSNRKLVRTKGVF